MKKLILISIGLFIVLSFGCIKAENNKKEKPNVTVDSTLTENNVYTMLLLYNIKYPEVVMSQIMIESAYLKSKLTKRNNNILGMTVPVKRQTTAINKSGLYAKYISWIDCVYDYKLYQDYIFSKNNIQTKKQYITFLHRNYANAPKYKTRLTELSKSYELRNLYNFNRL
jgi:uncharacterized FlgJ-related protein